MKTSLLTSFAILALTVGCGKKESDSNGAFVQQSNPEALVTVAECYKPDDTQKQQLVMISKTKDGSKLSPNSTSSMLVLFFKDQPTGQNQFGYPVDLTESESSIEIREAGWSRNADISLSIDRSTGKGHYRDVKQSFDLECKLPSAT